MKKTYGILFFIVFLDMLGIGILIPIIPHIITNPESSGYILKEAVSPKTSYILLGLVTGIYPLMQFFATPLLGTWSDFYGRKKILMICLFGTVFGYILTGSAIVMHSFMLLIIGRVIDGATGGNISVVQAIIADTTKPEDRSKAFGMIGAAFGLGFIFGPVLGGLLADPTFFSFAKAELPLWVAAGLSTIAAMIVYTKLPETHKEENRIKKAWSFTLAFVAIRKVLGSKTIRNFGITQFLYFSGFTFFTTFSAVFFINRFNISEKTLGLYFGFIGLWIVIAQAFLVRIIIKRFSEQKILRVALIANGIVLLMYFVPKTLTGILFVAPFFAIFNGLIGASVSGLVSKRAQAHEQGEVLGLMAGIQGLAACWPPIISGFIAAILSPYHPMIIGSTLMICAGIYFIFSFRNQNT